MHHYMHEDARRRFTFVLTAENADMRVWFCSWADILATKSFDFIEVSTGKVTMISLPIIAHIEPLECKELTEQ